MQHAIHRQGPGFALRPVTDADSDFIIQLRTDPTRSQFINATSPRREDQLAWLEKYYTRTGDYYFIITRHDGTPEGAIAIYDVVDQPGQRCGEWGRWILKKDSMAALESAWLIYGVAFDDLALDMVYCRTVAKNETVVSFHASCGLVTHGIIANNMVRDGVGYDAVEQRMSRQMWSSARPILQTQVERLAQRLLHR